VPAIKTAAVEISAAQDMSNRMGTSVLWVLAAAGILYFGAVLHPSRGAMLRHH
jgi:hypothetical protein